MEQRVYKTSDIRMLIACDVIADHALENLYPLESVNPAWNEAYFKEIKGRILVLLKEVFGLKSVKEFNRTAAGPVTLQTELRSHLTMLHKQIVTAYRRDIPRRKAILNDLGYTEWWRKVRSNGSQTALIAMLEVFDKGCTSALLDEFAAKKISGVSVDFVRNNLYRMFGLNMVQEGEKDRSRLVPAGVIDRFNEIYNDTMMYAGSAQTIFSRDPIRRKEFTFAHIVAQQNANSSGRSSGFGNDTL